MKTLSTTPCRAIFFLDIYTWVGSSAFEAEHYYANFAGKKWNFDKENLERFYDEKVSHALTQKECMHLNKKDYNIGGDWKPGEPSSRFECEKDILPEAIKLSEKLSGNDNFLLAKGCHYNCYFPIIKAPPWFEKEAKRLNAIYEQSLLDHRKASSNEVQKILKQFFDNHTTPTNN